MAKRLSPSQVQATKRHLTWQIEVGNANLVSGTARKFSISRQTVNRLLTEMVSEGVATASGNTRARRYELVILDSVTGAFPLSGLEESELWRHHVARLFTHQKSTAMSLANFAFTEIVNNAIDHSEGQMVSIMATRTVRAVRISVADDGVGVFKKIQDAFGLDEPSHAILELAKGKLTTDPARHSGMGIFFSSRACESFGMVANGLMFSHLASGHDLLSGWQQPNSGTSVMMVFDLYSTMTLGSLFKAYEADSAAGFSKTIIPVDLAEYGSENLVSRSQAKRVLTRVDRFKEVVWDFKNVPTIGQAFADEIFRVFWAEHADCHFRVVNAAEDVKTMIRLALAGLREQRPEFAFENAAIIDDVA